MTNPVARLGIPLLGLLLGLALAAPAHAVTIEKVTSPGGITAWLVEDHSLPLVTLDMAFRGGAALDPDDKAGLSELTSDLLDEGAGDLDSSAFQGRLEDLASSMDFNASQDAIDVDLHTLTVNLQPAFALLHLALTAPRFDAPAVARVRSQLLAALARDAREPHAISNRLWWQTEFPSHPYGRSERGTPESLAAITTDDMRGLLPARFAKDVLLIGIVGDITPAVLKPLLDETFGSLPDHAAAGNVAEVAAQGSSDTLLVRQPIPQSVVAFGETGLKRDDPDWYAALVVQYILGGGGLTSRLAAEVREKRGLAYSVSIVLDPLAHTGVILGNVGTENARVAESIALIRSEWQRMRDAGPTAKELADAKTYLTGSFPLSLDSTGRIAATLVAMQRDGLGIDYLDHRSALIDAVTLATAKRVAKRLFDPASLFFVVVGAPENLVGARVVTATGG